MAAIYNIVSNSIGLFALDKVGLATKINFLRGLEAKILQSLSNIQSPF
jgi:hypothetical protein